MESHAWNLELKPPSPHLRVLEFMTHAACSGICKLGHLYLFNYLYNSHSAILHGLLHFNEKSSEVSLGVGVVF